MEAARKVIRSTTFERLVELGFLERHTVSESTYTHDCK